MLYQQVVPAGLGGVASKNEAIRGRVKPAIEMSIVGREGYVDLKYVSGLQSTGGVQNSCGGLISIDAENNRYTMICIYIYIYTYTDWQ